MDGRMEGNNNLDHAIRRVPTENLLNPSPDFPGFLMQETHNTPRPSAVPTAGNNNLHPEIDHFYPREFWPQIRKLKESVDAMLAPARNLPENRHPPSPAAGPSARTHPFQLDVFYPEDIRHWNLAPAGNSAIYSHFHGQASSDPFFPGGESFWDSRSTDYGARVNPSFPDQLSLEAKFARLNFSEDLERPILSELLSVYGGAAPERRNSSSLNWLRGNEQPPQFSYGDLQALRARAAADGFMSPQAYPTFKDPFLNPDSYWVNRDSNGFKNNLGDTNAYNRGMNISGYNPRTGFNFSKHMPLSMNGVNSNNSVSSIPSPPRNCYIHGSTQMLTYSSLEDLKGRVISEATDQYGCRFLRHKLDERKPEDIQMIFSEVKDHVHTLMYDRFGNYVIQKLFEVCDQDQMSQLVSLLTADGHLLLAVCLDPQGYQSMQKFVECLMTQEQISDMISIFRHITVPLVNNQIGSRVIEHCLNIFPVEEAEKILNVIADNWVQIATDRSGCCLLQLFITKDSPLESQRRIVAGIVLNICELSKNQFGNYVVQHVIGLEIPNVINDMVDKLKGGFVPLSMDKYGSNVVEKLMKASHGKYALEIISEIISSPSFLSIVLDPYGNYVVQSAKKCATGATRKTLNNLIQEHSNDLHSHLYGKNVLINKEKTRYCI